MIITCPCCQKKFDVDESLIPASGKMLQCGACSKKWFFNKPLNKNPKSAHQRKELEQLSENIEIPKETETIIKEAEKIKFTENLELKSNYKISFFKIILIFIISFVALIILLDTFKLMINNILPGFIFFLDNFYLTLNDMILFLKDLIRK